MSTTGAPFTRADWKRVRQVQYAILRRRPWWVAMGQEEENGLRLGGVWRAWSTAERDLWDQWTLGGGHESACVATLQQRKALNIDTPWLLSLAQLFYSELMMDNPPTDWDDPVFSPTLCKVRWIQHWPWVPAKHGWDTGEGYHITSVKAFRPWAEVPVVGQPQSMGAWALVPLNDERRHSATSGTAPLAITMLIQVLILTALGGGHWDWATLNR